MIDAEYALRTTPQESAAEASVVRFCRDPAAAQVALTAKTRKGAAIPVVGNHGRWIVECPTGDGGAQFASTGDPRFMCVECLNVGIAGEWRPIVWPKDRDKLAEVLELRPQGNQNWTPGETVADLVRENEAHR